MAVVPRNSTYIIRKERNNQNQLFNAVNTTNFEEKTLQLSGDAGGLACGCNGVVLQTRRNGTK